MLNIGILGYFRKAHRKVPKFLEGKELFHMNMADTREIEYTIVPNIKAKSDVWKLFNLRERKTAGRVDGDVTVCQQCCSLLNLAGGTSNMSKHRKRHHPLSSLLVSFRFLTDLTARLLEVGSTASFYW